MMTGRVSSLHALLPVTFQLDSGTQISIEFVIDTGFTGDLTLPLSAVQHLGLPFFESIYANLATDDEVYLPVHTATILWNGNAIEARVLGTGKRPLLGTGLLQGYQLLAQFAEAGLVTIDSL